jgi:transcriptional regulator NrdR family protein
MNARHPDSRPTAVAGSDAVNCSLCGHDSKVLESRPTTDGRPLRRRRECVHCRYRWTTYEVTEAAYRRAQVLEQNARALMELL